MMTVRDQMM